MSNTKSFFASKSWKNIMKYIYGLGAAVVIMGALFKIMHWPFASEMLIVGLSTEALIFVMSVMEPVHLDKDWSRVFPELDDTEGKGVDEIEDVGLYDLLQKSNGSNINSINELNDIDVINLKESINDLSEKIKDISSSLNTISDDLTTSSLHTRSYKNSMEELSFTLKHINDKYSSMLDIFK